MPRAKQLIPLSVPTNIVARAIQSQLQQLERDRKELMDAYRLANGEAPAVRPVQQMPKPTGKRQMSMKGRKAIAEAQKRRWAAQKAKLASVVAKEKKKPVAAKTMAATA